MKMKIRKINRKKAVFMVIATALMIHLLYTPIVLAGTDDPITFPDSALKQALLDAGADTSSDGEITENELAALAGTLDLSSKGIEDVTGMQYATGLGSLDLSSNLITDITPLSTLVQLDALDVSGNYLDISEGSDNKNVVSTLTTAGCVVTDSPQNVHVTGVSLNKETMQLSPGGSDTLTATVTPDTATNKNVSWASSNTGVATVTNGTVTAVSIGEATITVTTQDGSFTDTCTVTVSQPVTGISLTPSSVEMCAGDTVSLTAAVAPDNATNKNVSWASSNTGVATVTNGTVTAVSVGEATITVTTQDGSFTATCSICVQSAQIASDVYTIDRTNGYLTDITKDTSAADLKANLTNHATNIVIYDQNGNEYTGDAVGTGMTIKLVVGGTVRDTLTAVVLGDINGDGHVSVIDYTLTRLDILGLKSLSGAYRQAGDINGDGGITIMDYTYMRLDILSLKTITSDLQITLPEVTDPQIKAFLEVALAQRGKPYVWSAEGPDSFDCSGYVWYCLRSVGYYVGRTTANSYSQYSQWQYVSREDLQPGDLMFYVSDSDPNRIGHIGIYLGDGYHIHASSTYGCVIICKMDGWYDEMFSHGRRVWY